MRIVDHQRKVIAHPHHLDPALDMDLKKSLFDLLGCDVEVPADSDRAQSVIDTEPPGRRDLRVEIEQSLHVKSHPEFAGLFDQLQVVCIQIRLRTQAVSFHTAGAAVEDPLVVRVVCVDDPHAALPEQKALAAKIIIEILVLRRADVIGRQIGEYAQIEDKSLRSVQHEGLRGYFHDDRLYACVRHIPESLLQDGGFRRRIMCLDPDIPVKRLDRPDQAYLQAGCFQNGLDHISRRCFSLCAGHADDLHLRGRIFVIRRRDICHCIARVLHPYDDRIFDRRFSLEIRQVQILLHDQCCGAVHQRLPRKFMAVTDSSDDAEKETIF